MTPDLNLGDTQLILAECHRQGITRAQTAYVLATAYWETARSMKPVREAYYLGEPRAEKYRKTLRYYPYYGRGYVQLTWAENYAKAGIANPDDALKPDVAARVLVVGMRDGWFTGRKLADYINDAGADFINARRIVNGTDKAGDIAAIARAYLAALPAPVAPWWQPVLDWLRKLWSNL